MTRTAYELRAASVEAHPGELVRRAAGAGFDGVAFGDGVPDGVVDAVADALDETGLEPVVAGVDLATLASATDEVLERCGRLDCRRLAVSDLGVDDLLTDMSTRATVDRLAKLGARLNDRGFQLVYRNAASDLRPVFSDAGLGGVLSIGPLPELVGKRATSAYQALDRPGPADLADRTRFGQLALRSTGRPVAFAVDADAVAAAGYRIEPVLALVAGRVTAVHVRRSDAAAHAVAAADAEGVPWVVAGSQVDGDDPARAIEHTADAVVPYATSAPTVTR